MAGFNKLIPVPQLINLLKKFLTITLHDGSRYVVGMLWADDNFHLPDNFYALLVQLKSLEKRLEKDLNLKTQYTSDIRGDFGRVTQYRLALTTKKTAQIEIDTYRTTQF